MKLTHTQRFQDTVYNFIHNCILNYIHTETNLSLSKYSASITTCLHMKNFVSIDVPFTIQGTGTLLSMYPSMKVHQNPK